jgi:hypothetical protein
MHALIAPPLESWATFYVIIGSCAGALTGLQFVVMTLIAQTEFSRSGGSIAAFGSPNVVHFCAAVLVAAIVSVPWHSLAPAGVSLGVTGVLGCVYTAVVIRRAQRQKEYQPVLEDWIWHNILPLVAYATLLIGGALLAARPEGALLAIGGATLLLVFIGIHNAWDTVTYVTLRGAEPKVESAPPVDTPPVPPPGLASA